LVVRIKSGIPRGASVLQSMAVLPSRLEVRIPEPFSIFFIFLFAETKHTVPRIHYFVISTAVTFDFITFGFSWNNHNPKIPGLYTFCPCCGQACLKENLVQSPLVLSRKRVYLLDENDPDEMEDSSQETEPPSPSKWQSPDLVSPIKRPLSPYSNLLRSRAGLPTPPQTPPIPTSPSPSHNRSSFRTPGCLRPIQI